MEKLIFFLISFIFIYLIYYLTVLRNINKNDKFINSNQALYFVKKYNVNFKKINVKSFANTIALVNSFIIALTATLIDFIDNYGLKLLVGFALVFLLIIVSYDIIGKKYGRKK